MEASLAMRELSLTAKEKLLDLGLPRKWAELLRMTIVQKLLIM